MFERLISFLKELPGGQAGQAGPDRDDPRLAAAALMVHLIDADGIRLDIERDRLKAAITDAYGLQGGALEEFIADAEELEREAVDLYAFTSVLKRHLDEAARIEFIGMLWELVFADGEMSELEDNIVWRVAELIGVDRRDRIAMRQRVNPAAVGGEPEE